MFLALLTKLGIPQWCAEMCLGAAIIAGLFGGGYYVGHHAAADDAQIAMQRAQLAHAAEMARLTNMGQQIQAKFESQQSQANVVYQQIVKEVPHVVTIYRTALDAAPQPLPRCIFTVGNVGLWNAAGNPVLPADSSRPADPPVAVDTPGSQLDSGVTQQDVLNNHIANAHECEAVKRRLNAIADWDARLPKQAGDQ